MEETHYAVGFYKGERRFLGYNSALGTCIVVGQLSEALRFTKQEAAVAALAMGLKFNLTHCRAVADSQAMNVTPA